MILKQKRDIFILIIAVSISLFLSEVNAGEVSQESYTSQSDEVAETFQLLANYFKKGRRYDRDSDESGERSGKSVDKLSEYISDLVEDKLRRKLGKVGGRRGGRFMDDSDERDKRRERSNRRKETTIRENKDYRKPYEPKKYQYNDYANNPKHNVPIYQEKSTIPRNTNNKTATSRFRNIQNLIYLMNLTIGDSPTVFRVSLSTAFSFIFVPASNLNKLDTFSPSNSSTAVCQNNPWNLQGLLVPHGFNGNSGNDNTSGLITCVDTVGFAGIKLYKQTFGVANVLDSYYGSVLRLDGALGLGLPSTNIFYGNSPLTNIEKQAQLDRKIFSIWLNSTFEVNLTRGGEITFGGVNSELFTGPIHYVSLSTPKVAWKIRVESFSLGSTVLATNFQALADVGDECMTFPRNVLNQISSIVNLNLTNNDRISIPCNITSSLPSLSYTIKTSNYDRHTFTVDSDSFTTLINPINNKCFVCLDFVSNDEWVLGMPFIRRFYTVFDSEKQQLGFAKAIRG